MIPKLSGLSVNCKHHLLRQVFGFTTLTTVDFSDTHPVTPAARALTVAEALVGQLYVSILIASLAGMALQTRSIEDERPAENLSTGPPRAEAFLAVE